LPTLAEPFLPTSSIEFSPARYYFNDLSEVNKSHSGTISFKLPEPTLELAIPILWLGEGNTAEDDSDPECCKHHFLALDLQLRKYFNDRREGFYAGIVARSITGNGYVNDKLVTESKVGTGATIGYRLVYEDSMYLSAGITWVTYREPFEYYDEVVLDTADQFRQQHSITYDFLKIGILLP